jgi:hypothetical protein
MPYDSVSTSVKLDQGSALRQQVTTPDIMTQQYRDMYFDELESISSTGSKRGRQDEEEDASWTESDLTAMQNVR